VLSLCCWPCWCVSIVGSLSRCWLMLVEIIGPVQTGSYDLNSSCGPFSASMECTPWSICALVESVCLSAFAAQQTHDPRGRSAAPPSAISRTWLAGVHTPAQAPQPTEPTHPPAQALLQLKQASGGNSQHFTPTDRVRVRRRRDRIHEAYRA
jgi:hypothetical protein